MASHHRALEDSDVALIERVKFTPSLYDPQNPDFRLAYRKEHDWDAVASCLGMSPADARRRWTCLRDRYSRELKQLRLHPEKEEFGKNDFFQQMDFLRKFVRKRRGRRRNILSKYDSSWDNSTEDTKMAKVPQSAEEEEVEEELVDRHNHTEVAQNNFSNKIVMPVAETEEFNPEYVEVDAAEAFANYVEQQAAESSNSSVSTKAANNVLLPSVLPPAESETKYLSQRPPNMAGTILQTLPVQTTNQHVQTSTAEVTNETEDDYFCKSVAVYLRQLSLRHKIKAKVEMFQILEKYIELEVDQKSVCSEPKS